MHLVEGRVPEDQHLLELEWSEPLDSAYLPPGPGPRYGMQCTSCLGSARSGCSRNRASEFRDPGKDCRGATCNADDVSILVKECGDVAWTGLLLDVQVCSTFTLDGFAFAWSYCLCGVVLLLNVCLLPLYAV